MDIVFRTEPLPEGAARAIRREVSTNWGYRPDRGYVADTQTIGDQINAFMASFDPVAEEAIQDAVPFSDEDRAMFRTIATHSGGPKVDAATVRATYGGHLKQIRRG